MDASEITTSTTRGFAMKMDDLLTQLETCLEKATFMQWTVIEDHFSKAELSQHDIETIVYSYYNICTALHIADDYTFESRDIVTKLREAIDEEENK